MEPEDDSLLLDGDDLATESSDGDVLDESVPPVYVFFMKTE